MAHYATLPRLRVRASHSRSSDADRAPIREGSAEAFNCAVSTGQAEHDRAAASAKLPRCDKSELSLVANYPPTALAAEAIKFQLEQKLKFPHLAASVRGGLLQDVPERV